MTSRDPLRSSLSTSNEGVANKSRANDTKNVNSSMRGNKTSSTSSPNNYESLRTTFNKLKTNQLPTMAENKLKEKLNDMPNVLTSSQLKNLDQHKYASTGTTLLDKYYQPFWRWLVEQMPMNLAPNLITTIGLLINIISCTILMLYSPNANEDPPSWSLLLCSIGLFVYQALDAIDGKQARRTDSSTPLGELFDHGCDSISTIFVVLAFCVTMKLGDYPWFMFLCCFMAMSAFYTAHWQTYVTGSLKFGLIDVTEAQTIMYLIFALTGLFGDGIWAWNLPILNIEFRFVPTFIGLIGSFSSVFENIKTISQGGVGRHGSSVAGTSIVFPLFPLALFLFMSFSIASKSTNVYLSNICLYTLTFGIVWAKITIKLIIAHMTKGEIFLLDSCLVGPVTLLLNQYFSYMIPEIIVLYVSLIIATLDLVRYSSKVCYQICNHLNIYLFKITKPHATQAETKQ